jgi:hypothetical protein
LLKNVLLVVQLARSPLHCRSCLWAAATLGRCRSAPASAGCCRCSSTFAACCRAAGPAQRFCLCPWPGHVVVEGYLEQQGLPYTVFQPL